MTRKVAPQRNNGFEREDGLECFGGDRLREQGPLTESAVLVLKTCELPALFDALS